MNIKARPLVSVIIPTYNHARYLSRALQSISDQTFTNWEIIIVDNHSTDNTNKVISNFMCKNLTHLKINNNGVIAKSRNAGIEVARGIWVAFLDSDDWWTSNKLQAIFECISEDVNLIYHDLEIVSNQPRFFGRKKIKSKQVQKPILINLLLKGNVIGNSSVVVRTSLLHRIGGINESEEMIAAEDYNAWLRIAQLTDGFKYLPKKLGYYFTHNEGISQKDMSIAGRCAVKEFLPLLDKNQKLILEANFRYTKGRFNYSLGDYALARNDLLFTVKHGYIILVIKASLLLLMSLLKNIGGEDRL